MAAAALDQGAGLAAAADGEPGRKVQSTAFLLSAFLGLLGIDQFYLGNIGLGILKLITFGGLGFWSLVDAILIGGGYKRDHWGRELYRPPAEGTPVKSPMITVVLSGFFGTLGVDRFYLGSILLGVLKLITFGGFGIWATIDFMRAGMGFIKDGEGNSLLYESDVGDGAAPVEPLGCLYWGAAVFFGWVAFIWGLTLPKAHPSRVMAIVAPLIIMFVEGLIMVGAVAVAVPMLVGGLSLPGFIDEEPSIREAIASIPMDEEIPTFTAENTRDVLLGYGVPAEPESLFVAIEMERQNVIWTLLFAGVNINARDENGETALHKAIKAGRADYTQALLENIGIENDIADVKGRTPLILASRARGANMEYVVLNLVANGAWVNAEDGDGWTPLMGVVTMGYPRCVEALLAKGALVDKRNNEGKNALDYASESGNQEIVAQLKNLGS